MVEEPNLIEFESSLGWTNMADLAACGIPYDPGDWVDCCCCVPKGPIFPKTGWVTTASIYLPLSGQETVI